MFLWSPARMLSIWQTAGMSSLILRLVIYLFLLIARESAVLVSGCVCILNAGLVTDALQDASHDALLCIGNTFMIWNSHLWWKTWHHIWALNASKRGNAIAIRSYGEAMSDFPVASKIITSRTVGSKNAFILVLDTEEELIKWEGGNIYCSQMLYPKNVHI